MHPDLYNFHTRSLATTSATLGSSTCSALALTEPGKTGNHRSCQYSHSWNDGRSLATAGFFTPAKQALGTTLTSTALTIQHGANGTAPPSLSKGVTAITTSPLLANSAVHNFDSVLFGSHDNFSALSVLPSQQQGLPSSGHLLHSLGICLLKPVSQPTPITEDRFQHELCLHPNPDKVVYVGQGLGDDFHLGFNYYSTSFKWRGGGGGYGFGTHKPTCHWKFRQAGWQPLHLACPPCRPCEPFQCLTQTPPTWEMSSLACQALLVTVSLTGLRARIILYSTWR